MTAGRVALAARWRVTSCVAGMVAAAAVGDRIPSKKPLLMAIYVLSSVIFAFVVVDVNGTVVPNDPAVRCCVCGVGCVCYWFTTCSGSPTTQGQSSARTAVIFVAIVVGSGIVNAGGAD